MRGGDGVNLGAVWFHIFFSVNDSRSKWVTLLGVWMGSAVINCSVNRCSPVEIHYPSAPNGISSRSCKKSTPLPPSSAPRACVLRPNLLRFPARLPHPAPTSAAVPATPTAEATPLLRRSRLFFRDQALHPYFIKRGSRVFF
jgi:hypothetical protein